MFERAGQVNASFAGGSSRPAEIVAALRQTGLTAEEIHVIDRVDAGHWAEGARARRPGVPRRGGALVSRPRHERVRPLPGSAGAVPAGHAARGTILDLRPTRGGGRGCGASAPEGGGPDRFFDNGSVAGALRALGRALRRAWHTTTGPGRPFDRPRVGQRVTFAVGIAPASPIARAPRRAARAARGSR